jgi:hypothetical protein
MWFSLELVEGLVNKENIVRLMYVLHLLPLLLEHRLQMQLLRFNELHCCMERVGLKVACWQAPILPGVRHP